MTRLDDLRASVEPLGFTVDTYSPGDGVTRYRFFRLEPTAPLGTFKLPEHDGRHNYFGANGIFTALGFGEASTFARGLAHGATRHEGS